MIDELSVERVTGPVLHRAHVLCKFASDVNIYLFITSEDREHSPGRAGALSGRSGAHTIDAASRLETRAVRRRDASGNDDS